MEYQATTRWQAFTGRLGANYYSSETVLEILLDSYRQYFRHYHGLSHLADCFKHLDEIKTELTNYDLVEYALWFHDIVCVPNAKSNEALSAAAAYYAAARLGFADEFSRQAVRLILLTNHKAAAESTDEAYLLDIDLAVLGREWDSFLGYEYQIRAEYSHMPEFDYRQGRQQFISVFLSRDTIYQTDYFRKKYEQTARRNLVALQGFLANQIIGVTDGRV